MAFSLSRRQMVTGTLALPAAGLLVGTAATPAFAARVPDVGRQDVLNRARHRISTGVRYLSQVDHDFEGYRTDCSGFVAYAWGFGADPGTSEMVGWEVDQIAWEALQPGDAFNRPLSGDAGHVMLFSRWLDSGWDRFEAMEHAGPDGAPPKISTHLRSTVLNQGYKPVTYKYLNRLKPYGLILDKWNQDRAIMGNPTNDEFSTNPRGSGRFRDFQQGMIVWKTGTASAWRVHGEIFKFYRANGSETKFGFPLFDEEAEAGGRKQRFERGTLHWSPTRGVWAS